MVSPVLGIRDKTLEILKRTCDMRLAVSLKDRHIDKKIPVSDTAAYRKFFSYAFNAFTIFFLLVNKRNTLSS